MPIQPRYGLNLTEMLEAMAEGEVTTCYLIGENPVQSEADSLSCIKRLSMLDHLVVQDIFLDQDGPDGRRGAARRGGLVRVRRHLHQQRAPRPAGARRRWCRRARPATTSGSCASWPAGSATTGPYETSEQVWNEAARALPAYYGMTYDRLEEHQGHPVAVPLDRQPRTAYLHGRAVGDRPGEDAAVRRRSAILRHSPPVDLLDDEYPFRLTTGRRLDSYNTGVQSSGFASPLRRGETIELSPEDAEKLGVTAGEEVRIQLAAGRRRGPVWIDPALRPGLRVHDDALPRRGRHQRP